ncbi:MAG TPA: GNAT family N-acetyltransferase, partial [Burkholderiaceae bacterium]|nr:GNAT family N-acetyltransferase [Burkholderiaceae bacterium]
PLGLNASRLGPLPAAGNVALVTQSGVVGSAILDWTGDTPTGFSAVVSLGAEADVDLSQVLDFLASDAQTKAVALYLEAVHDARGFMSALRALATIKPVVVLKAGRDASTRGVARTHSGALVVADAVYGAAMRRAGAVQVRLFTQLFTAVRYLSARNWPIGKRLGIISNGHGPALLAADQAAMQRIELLQYSEASLAKLAEHGVAGPVAVNPLNLGIDAGPDDYANAIEVLSADSNSDALLALLTPAPGVDAEGIADRIAGIARSIPKPLFACWLGDRSVNRLRPRLVAAGVPVYRTPEAAVDAFSTVATFYQNQLLLLQAPRSMSDQDSPDVEGARSIIDDVLAEGREVMTEIESKALLGAFNIGVTQTVLARSASEAVMLAEQIGFPVVMKIASHDVSRKSDYGGVALNVRNAAEVRLQFTAIVASVRELLPEARVEGVSLQPMVRGRSGRELYVGVFRNRLFGPVVAFGAGGTRVELLRDTTLEFPPLNDFLARSMIGRTRVAASLEAFRGTPAIDDEALVRALVRVSEMICELPHLAEMDINPLICDENGAIAVDARIVLDPSPPQTGARYGHMAILPYPAHMEREATLRDGRSYLIRPIQGEDADRLQRFTRGLSPQSRYFRFISALNELTPRMLIRYTQIDYDRELALVAVLHYEPALEGEAASLTHDPGEGERFIGVARYLLNVDRDTCEFAVAIGDDYQGQGLGTTLMRALIDVARQRGLERMDGFVLAGNTPMLRLMRSLGFKIARDPDDESMKIVSLMLQEPPPGEAASGAAAPGAPAPGA